MEQNIFNTQGAFVHEIGGTQTHVHVAVTAAPTLSISEFIGQLDWVKAYIVRQREHHARGTVQDRLERITKDA